MEEMWPSKTSADISTSTECCQNSEADENEKFMWITTQILNLTFYNLDCGLHLIPSLYLFFSIIETCLEMEAFVFYWCLLPH